MVKAEFKVSGSKNFPIVEETKAKVELQDEAEETLVELVESKDTKIEDGEVVLAESNAERSRRRPKTCAFMCFFVLILVVGFLIVFFIGRANKDLTPGLKSDDVRLFCGVNSPPTEVSTNVSVLWEEVSWETREELFQLSDTIGNQDNILGLTPIYRKDLPSNYIAYWELKLHGKKGDKYVIISAAKQTGDYRLAEEGGLPSPSDRLRDKAEKRGYRCHLIFRLSPDGLMVCEDVAVHHIVASTRDLESSAWDDKWTTLDYQVSKELPKLKKEWDAHARRMHRLPEWNRFKWLSMATGEDHRHTTRPTPSDPSPTVVLFDLNEELRGFDNRDFKVSKFSFNYNDFEAELGLRPGESIRIPIGRGFRGVRVKFIGFGHRRGKKRRGWSKRWQKRLCRVLCDLCEEDEWGGNTRVKPKYLKMSKMGERYLQVRINSNDRFVRKQLHGQEIRFRVELKLSKYKYIVIHYGIILKSRHRGPRAVQLHEHSIPHREWVPDYVQHKHGQCWTGSGPVAWAILLGYYDNLAHKAPQLGYRKTHFSLFGSEQAAPLDSSPKVKTLIEEIHESLGTSCAARGSGITPPSKMKRILKWYRARFGATLNMVYRGGSNGGENGTSAPTALAIKLLKEGTPVIVSREGRAWGEHDFAVATALRQRSHSYRLCKGEDCSGWTTLTESEIFVREGFDGKADRWETADTNFMAAVLKPSP